MPHTHEPDFDQFLQLVRRHPECTVVPVWRRLTGDGLTPVTAYRLLEGSGQRPGFLFESVVGGERVGRYSFVSTAPVLTLAYRGDAPSVAFADDASADLFLDAQLPRLLEQLPPDPLGGLKAVMLRLRGPHLPGMPRFLGGAVGYVGYDVVRQYEPLGRGPEDDRGLPDLVFGFYDRMIVFDHIQKTILVVAHAHLPPPEGRTFERLRNCYERAAEAVDVLVDRICSSPPWLAPVDAPQSPEVNWPFRSNFSRERFEEAVRRCKEYIVAGDIFQVVISQRLEADTRATPFDIYRALRVVNPSPFMFYLDLNDCYLVGASPEIMVRVEDGWITTRPLAGTRPRGATEEEDRALERELLADEKERAEHVMLVDLGRNDVGRVAQYGTIELSDVMTVERYSHVMHITSNVCGRLRPELHAVDALRACLPAGTVSGAPKVRAMQIIDELEPHRRGPYAGAVGYVDFTGNMDTCIALRTMVIASGRVYVQAGAGIVHDSVPAREYEETLNKAKGMLKAIELAERYITQAASTQR